MPRMSDIIHKIDDSLIGLLAGQWRRRAAHLQASDPAGAQVLASCSAELMKLLDDDIARREQNARTAEESARQLGS